jgi:AraC family transcriptional activator of pobA
MTPDIKRIARYRLYHESLDQSDPEFIHIEDIPSRARVFDWAINIHTHPGMYQLVFVEQGHVRIMLDGNEYHQQGPCFISVPPGVVHGFEFEREATSGWVVTVAELVLMDEHFQLEFPFRSTLLSQPGVVSMAHVHPRESGIVGDYLQQLNEEYCFHHSGRLPMFAWLLYALLTRLGRVQEEQQRASAPQAPQEERYSRLIQLIENHYREHWPIERFASELNTTTSSLNRTCKRISDLTAADLLYNRLALEAQRLLIYTAVPVAQIGYELGFSDPAYFSRFFRKRVGISPSDFREQRHKASN